ncbi:MAG: putative DNA binding domain-containing protein [Candidatus Cloacimonetes bacterium]|nr:putative DNA binding domain-containing protein [Candidatus Cloacimonadota bacterium]
MSKEELLKAIKSPEWTGMEFKQCRKGVSDDAYKTVSAFANTSGGYLVFGIKESAKKAEREIVGVEDVDKVQNDFLSCLRNGGKLSRVILSDAELHEIDGKHVLVFYIPEADRKDKPVYLGKRIDQAYIRRGGGDELCTESELRAFIRDASDLPFDRSLEHGIDPSNFINPSTLKWYRTLLDKNPTSKYAHLSDLDFLLEMGLLIEEKGKVTPTKAAVLLFGQDRFVRQILSRPVVDYQRIDQMEDNWDADKRWHDRLVIESNLFEAWRVLIDKYSLIADVPFSLDETTMQRKDDTLEFRSFREAAVNLLIHQDYGDASRKAEIKIFKDKTIFWNPGSAYSSVEALLESRHHSIRNPLIVRIFRQIGLCEEAGTGIRTIMEDCRRLGLFPAQITNDKSDFNFSIAILKKQIITEHYKDLLSKLGIQLNAEEAAIFSYLVRYRKLSLPIAKAITGKSSELTLNLMLSIEARELIEPIHPRQTWSLSEYIANQLDRSDSEGGSDQVTDQVTDQAGKLLKSGDVYKLVHQLSKTQKLVIQACVTPQSITNLMELAGVTNRTYFRRTNITPLLNYRLITMLYPSEPNHPEQAYKTSMLGISILKLIQLSEAKDND